MTPNVETLQALRDCCRDDAAFERLKQILGIISTQTSSGQVRSPNHQSLTLPSPELAPSNESVVQDITYREQVEQALQESEAKYRELIENANSIILRLDTQGRITFFNEFAQNFFGYTEAEILGRSAVGTIIPETETSGRNLSTLIQDIIRNPEQYQCHENENTRRQGSRVWVAWTNKAIFDAQGQVIGILCIGNDITARHQAQEALRTSESRYRALSEELEHRVRDRTTELTQANEQLRIEIAQRQQMEIALEQERNFVSAVLDTAGALVVVLNQQGKIVRFNQACEETTGYSFEEIQGKTVWDCFLLPNEVEPVQQVVAQLLTGAFGACCHLPLQAELTPNFPYQYENYWVARDGTCRLIAWSNTVLRDRDGFVDYIICIGIDVTERRTAERALKDSEAWYKALIQRSTDVIDVLDKNGNYLYASPSNYHVLGREPNELIGKPCWTLIHPDDVLIARTAFEKVLQNPGQAVQITLRVSHQNSHWIYMEISGRNLLDEPAVKGIVLNSRDVTEQQNAKEREQKLITSLQDAKDQLQAVLDAVPGCISWMGSDLKYLGVNGYLARTFKVSPEDFIGQPLGFRNSASKFEDFVRNFFANSEQEASQELEMDVNGSTRYFFLIAQKYHHGQAAVWIGFDITQLKETEEALREAVDKFTKAFRCCPDSIAITTLAEGRIIDVNDVFLRTSGYDRDEIIGRTTQEINLWVNIADRNHAIQILQQQGAIHNQEYEFRNKFGEIRIGLFSAEVITLEGERCVLSLTSDITERKQAEKRLKESEQQYRAIFESTSDGLIINDLDGRVVEANPAACQMHGYSYEEFINLDPKTCIHPDYYPAFQQYINTTKQGVPFLAEALSLRKDGTPFPLEVRGTNFTYKGKPHLLAVLRDSTERKQAEEQLKEAANRERLLGEIATRIRQSLNLDEILNTTVEEVRQFLKADRVVISYIDESSRGKVIAESVAKSWPSCLKLAVKDDNYLQELITLFQQNDVHNIEDTNLIEKSPERAKFLHQYKVRAALGVAIVLDNQLYGLLVAHQCSAPRHWQPLEVNLLQSLATQVAIAIQQGRLYQQTTQLNQQLSILNANLERQVEKRTTQIRQQMQELQKLNELKDMFLHAVSHDLRTPVMGMLMVLNNLLKSQENEEKRQDGISSSSIPVPRSAIKRMIQSSDRQLELINSLLEVRATEVQGLTVEPSPLPLSQLLNALIADLEPLLVKNQTTLTNLVQDDLPLVSADSTQLWRVFENLITNAFKHNPPGVSITLSATVDFDSGETNQNPNNIQSQQSPKRPKSKIKNPRLGMMRCAIADNGVGMTPEQCDHLFDPYYRGSDSRHLTSIGLGLYLCRQIITAHGGQIGVISYPGTGTTFWFTLPLAHH
ncbi:MAG TPA: PAS domain S-box protein [Coleofasciculaceae cyanobacterium]